MSDTLKTFIINPIDGRPSSEVQATKVEFSENTGRTIFYNGEDIVGLFVNINFFQKTDVVD